MEADLLITNSEVITVYKEISVKQAVAVKEGKIISVVTNNAITI